MDLFLGKLFQQISNLLVPKLLNEKYLDTPSFFFQVINKNMTT